MADLKQAEIDCATVQTNIVIFKLHGVTDVAPVLAAMKHRGVLAGTAATDQIRFVTHNDIDRAACEQAAKVAAQAIAAAVR